MLCRSTILSFSREHYGGARVHDIAAAPLRGGLEAEGIARVRVIACDGRTIGTFVVKPMPKHSAHEYQVHRALERAACGQIAARVLGSRSVGRTRYLFLEWVPQASRWPWRAPACASTVLDQLARVHTCDSTVLAPILSRWDYDGDLRESARATLDLYSEQFLRGDRVCSRPMAKTLARISAALPAMRSQLIGYTGSAVLHGDAHPGNAVLRRAGGRYEAVLLDWGRARIGSPLEDVMSWLHSLGFWEPEARRVHDTLLRRYAEARGQSARLGSDFRAACWLAGACNSMAGALRYHLAVSGDRERTEAERWNSKRAAADWLRILRRADAVWRS